MRHSDPLVTGALILLFIVAVAILKIRDAVRSSREKRGLEERRKAVAEEAEAFFRKMALRNKLPAIPVNIILKPGEVGIFQEPSVLYESRAYRLYGGGGTRIQGIYIGGGASESHQRLRQIDTGRLILTSQRLVFDGQMESRAVNLWDVISANPWTDAIEVSSSRKQKSQICSVRNPLIWSRVIEMFATGKLAITGEPEDVPTQAPSGRK